MGITTVADLATTDATVLTSTFGPTTGLWILLLAKGGGDTKVSAEPWVPRSRSHVVTFPRDLTDRSEMDSARNGIGAARAQRGGGAVPGGDPGGRHSTDQHLLHPDQDPQAGTPSTDAEVITAAALRILDLFELDRPIRLLGVRLELGAARGGY